MPKKKGQRATTDLVFDLSFTAANPRLTNPELGIAGVVARGRDHTYQMDVTLLDAPDQRLLHSGIVLAHRVVDGRGEWYLDAPAWAPWLPVDHVEPMAEVELPQAWTDLVLPFRRWATLGPVAALTCERAEFILRDADRRPLALLRDDKVTATRAGLTFARYREVTLTPIALSRQQASFLSETLQAIGGSRVPERPSLLQRLGATSVLADQASEQWAADLDIDALVGRLVARRQQQLIGADLRVRSGATSSTTALTDVLSQLQREVRGLSSLLEPDWLEDTDGELAWAIGALPSGPRVLRTERYLRLLDGLVVAARSPRVGANGASPAAEVLRVVVEQAVVAFAKAGRKLTLTGTDETWQRAVATGQQVLDACAVSELVLPEWTARVQRRTRRLLDPLHDCTAPEQAQLQQRHTGPASSATLAEAFEAGRRFERLAATVARARRAVLTDWPQRMAKLQGSVHR